MRNSVSNITQHAQATRAQLHIEYTREAVRLEVNDNGKGFIVPDSPAEFAPGSHFGLLGLYERAEMIGARWNLLAPLSVLLEEIIA